MTIVNVMADGKIVKDLAGKRVGLADHTELYRTIRAIAEKQKKGGSDNAKN